MVRIKQVALGWNHSLAVTPNGLLFAWGFNFHGELGIGRRDDLDKPKQLKTVQEYNITCISAGQFHSAAVTECGKLFTWGHNKTGRLMRAEDRLPNTSQIKNSYFPEEAPIEHQGSAVEVS